MNKVAYVSDLMCGSGLTALAVCETWLTSEISSSYVNLPGFRFFRGDVAGAVRKHGVGLYVKDSLNVVPIEVDIPNILSVYVGEWDVHLIAVYRPPSYSQEENLGLLSFLTEYTVDNDVIIMGDFNLPSLRWDLANMLDGYITPLDSLFYDTFAVAGLTQWVDQPTYVPSGNVLDLILTSDVNVVGNIEIFPPLPNCHHCPVVFEYFCNSVLIQDDVSEVLQRQWFKANYPGMNQELHGLNWDLLFADNNVGKCYDLFLLELNRLIDKYVPLAHNRGTPVWLSPPPGAMVRQRATAWKSYKSLRHRLGRRHVETLAALDRYLSLNKEYRSFSKDKQCSYERNIVCSLGSNPKLFHSYIRRKKKGRPPVGPLTTPYGTVSGDREMSEVFVEYFASIFVGTDPVSPADHQVFDGHMDPLNISYDSVRKLLLGLNGSGAPGPDGIHPQVLKSCASALAYPLCNIFRSSLNSASLPSSWKHSTVMPILGPRGRRMPLHYRPVSLTSVCCKTMERLAGAHSVDYMESNALLSTNQFGFRAGRSTEDQLLLFYGNIASWVDKGSIVDVVFMDFSKAFDLVSHTLIVAKLRLLGFDDVLVNWIESFLVGRTMSVSVSGSLSSERSVTSGVPQGSVLGPILFLIYVNHITKDVHLDWKAFADDFKLCVSYPRDSSAENYDAVQALQRDLNSLCEVSKSWGLRLNPLKCCAMRFGKGTQRTEESTRYYIEDHLLQFVESYKDLGVIVDSSLRFHQHIRLLTAKAGGLMGELLRSTVCRTREFMLTLFVSHIRPIIDYCSCVWNVGYIEDIRKLESLQRRWTREIDGLGGLDYVTRLKTVGLYSIRGRLLRADLVKIWKAFNAEVDVGVAQLFEMARSVGTRGHSFKMSVPVCRSEVLRRSFGVRRVMLWNSLPSSVVETSSVGTFKRLLDEFLGDTLFGVS